jgi:hypothetical protein
MQGKRRSPAVAVKYKIPAVVFRKIIRVGCVFTACDRLLWMIFCNSQNF